MPDGTRVFEPAPGRGPAIDTHEVALDTGEVVRRQRVSLAGMGDTDVLALPHPPPEDAFGLVTRPVRARARAHHGESLPLAPLTTGDVVEAIQETDALVHGFTATGTGDGTFRLLVNDDVVSLGRIDNWNRAVERTIPVGVFVPQGAVVRLTVRCESENASCVYEASVFTEVLSG